MAGHVRNICECGKVINQCRCIGPHSIVIHSPCIHAISATTHSEPISLEVMINAKAELEKLGEIPNLLRMHRSTYHALMMYLDAKEGEEELLGVERAELPLTSLGNILAIPILIDNKLKPGEWKFERRFYD